MTILFVVQVKVMKAHKQDLLRRYRRNKRLLLVAVALLLAVLGQLLGWWLPSIALLFGWLFHEAWFADHLFYSPKVDYRYVFPAEATRQAVSLATGRVQLSAPPPVGETLILEVVLHATWLGRWRDPHVLLDDDRQDFELGACGRRYLNLSGKASLLATGELTIRGRHCRLSAGGTLYALRNPDFLRRRILILAPHADDAELAAFGVYRQAEDVTIVTLTQGEIEADPYRQHGLDAAQAARLKGRLRTWDSLAIPLWGGVPQSRCLQLGYYCLRLAAMLDEPAQPCPSLESAENDIRTARAYNSLRLPADADGVPSGNNLIADLVAVLEHYRPEVVVTPHPELDPHPDHVATTTALATALRQSQWRPEVALLYANHLHDNDRWPLGPAGYGTALPPTSTGLPADGLWSPVMSGEMQIDKAMALAMQHDLQGRLSLKRRLRRIIQRLLVGRRHPPGGDNSYFRKAVRRHEIFWVRYFKP